MAVRLAQPMAGRMVEYWAVPTAASSVEEKAAMRGRTTAVWTAVTRAARMATRTAAQSAA